MISSTFLIEADARELPPNLVTVFFSLIVSLIHYTKVQLLLMYLDEHKIIDSVEEEIVIIQILQFCYIL